MTPETIKILQWVGTAIGAVTLWYKDTIAIRLGIKQGEKNLEKEALENLQKNLDIYQEMVSDIDARYKAKIVELEATFQASITKLQADIVELQGINEQLSDIIKKQTARIKYYTKKYGEEDKL
ncbi:hypothetical protein [Psychroserpens mesophilus]|uniref:hypothetical protein n=1 Tax=Psychroserpens mesophilus TaxID=325473 RepID=UPI003D6507B2